MRRKVKTIEVQCDVTTPAGTSESIRARVAVNKINTLNGNGLTTEALHELRKKGTCSSVDSIGNKYVYTLLTGSEKDVDVAEVASMNEVPKEQPGEKNEKTTNSI
jgi:hypothetical protein